MSGCLWGLTSSLHSKQYKHLCFLNTQHFWTLEGFLAMSSPVSGSEEWVPWVWIQCLWDSLWAGDLACLCITCAEKMPYSALQDFREISDLDHSRQVFRISPKPTQHRWCWVRWLGKYFVGRFGSFLASELCLSCRCWYRLQKLSFHLYSRLRTGQDQVTKHPYSVSFLIGNVLGCLHPCPELL